MDIGQIIFEGTYKRIYKKTIIFWIINKIQRKKKERDKKERVKDKNDNEKIDNIKINTDIKKVSKNYDKFKFITKEVSKETGKIGLKIYLIYLSYIDSIKFCIILAIVLILWQGLRITSDLWLWFLREHQGEKSNVYFFLI